MRVNARPGRSEFARVKIRPEAFTVIPRRFLKTCLGPLTTPGVIRQKSKNKRKHTPLSYGAIQKARTRSPHLSRARSNSKAAAGADHVATQQRRQGTRGVTFVPARVGVHTMAMGSLPDDQVRHRPDYRYIDKAAVPSG